MRKRFTRIISLCLILASLFAIGANAASVSDFTDVKTTDWFYPELQYAVACNIINGTSATTFSPSATMTRAQFATVLGRAMGASEDTTGTKFTDVPNGTWYSPYVYWAVEKGIVNGTSNTTFSPDDNIHREDMVTMIGRMITAYDYALAADPDAVTSFKDADKVADYAVESVEMLRKAAILKGDTNGYVNPKSDLTRAEGMAILVRVMQSVGNGSFVEPDTSTDDSDGTPVITYPTEATEPCANGGCVSTEIVDPLFSQNPFFAPYIPLVCTVCGNRAFEYKDSADGSGTYDPTGPDFIYNADGSVTATVLMTATTSKTITIYEKAAGTFGPEDIEQFLDLVGFDGTVAPKNETELGYTELIPEWGRVGVWFGYYPGGPAIKDGSYLNICLEIIRRANEAKVDALLFRQDLKDVVFSGWAVKDHTINMHIYYK